MGIEPTSSAWKAEVLPLNYARKATASRRNPLVFQHPRLITMRCCLVEGGGFEPPKAEPADLQSAPVDRLGTPPRHKPAILMDPGTPCQQRYRRRSASTSATASPEGPATRQPVSLTDTGVPADTPPPGPVRATVPGCRQQRAGGTDDRFTCAARPVKLANRRAQSSAAALSIRGATSWESVS